MLAAATYVLFGLANILLFGLHSHGDATFSFALFGAKVGVPNLVLPAAPVCYALGVVCIAIGVLRAADPAGPGGQADLHRRGRVLLRGVPAVLGRRRATPPR